MKKLLLLIFGITIMMSQESINGQSVKREDWPLKKSESWVKAGDWKKGMKLDVHPSVNAQEFAYQYHKNKAYWDKAFEFLKNTKLDTLSVGKHILDGENVFVSVMEGPTKKFEDAKWEAHRKYIDIQYVITGKETMGAVPLDKAKIIDSFNSEKDIAFYTANEKDARYNEANPKAFLIFFPVDVHRPGIKIEGCDATKKLVVKIKAD